MTPLPASDRMPMGSALHSAKSTFSLEETAKKDSTETIVKPLIRRRHVPKNTDSFLKNNFLDGEIQTKIECENIVDATFDDNTFDMMERKPNNQIEEHSPVFEENSAEIEPSTKNFSKGTMLLMSVTELSKQKPRSQHLTLSKKNILSDEPNAAGSAVATIGKPFDLSFGMPSPSRHLTVLKGSPDKIREQQDPGKSASLPIIDCKHWKSRMRVKRHYFFSNDSSVTLILTSITRTLLPPTSPTQQPCRKYDHPTHPGHLLPDCCYQCSNSEGNQESHRTGNTYPCHPTWSPGNQVHQFCRSCLRKIFKKVHAADACQGDSAGQ